MDNNARRRAAGPIDTAAKMLSQMSAELGH